jgi:hypothetical protein
MKSKKFTKMISNYVWNETGRLSDKELIKIIKRCRRFTTANCGWIEYDIRNILIECAELHVKDKELLK